MSFDKLFDFAAGVYFNFYSMKLVAWDNTIKRKYQSMSRFPNNVQLVARGNALMFRLLVARYFRIGATLYVLITLCPPTLSGLF